MNCKTVLCLCTVVYVKWLDKSNFTFFFGNHGHCILCLKQEGNHPACYQCTVEKPESMIAWRCVSAHGMGSSHILEVTISAIQHKPMRDTPTVKQQNIWKTFFCQNSINWSHWFLVISVFALDQKAYYLWWKFLFQLCQEIQIKKNYNVRFLLFPTWFGIKALKITTTQWMILL